jgi:phosphoglycolate phosphatase-like HAD superfamily hydrolase
MATSIPPSTHPRLLVLWDVDHTLIETRGVGRAIYDRAFPAATGRHLHKLAKISGRTELDIMAESLKVNGLDASDEMVRKLADALVRGYEDARDELRRTGRMLAGADTTLATLAQNAAIYQSVLSGNLRAVARIKLEVFGLDRYLDFAAGAYGDDDPERPKLVAIAQQRASDRTGVVFGNDATVLVGDTPNDVAAGLAAGVLVIAVATGKSDIDDLRAAGATWAIRSLSDCLAILNALAA